MQLHLFQNEKKTSYVTLKDSIFLEFSRIKLFCHRRRHAWHVRAIANLSCKQSSNIVASVLSVHQTRRNNSWRSQTQRCRWRSDIHTGYVYTGIMFAISLSIPLAKELLGVCRRAILGLLLQSTGAVRTIKLRPKQRTVAARKSRRISRL